jgi:iron complex outermembrane receptor protein
MSLSRLFKLVALVAILPLFGMFMATPLMAQDAVTITGTVTDASTGAPLRDVTVSIIGTNRTSQTSAVGTYSIRVLAGSYTLQATSIGYAPGEQAISVSAGDSPTVNFELSSQAIQMGNVLVAIGSRTARTATQTPVPIDVITGTEIRESGHTELNQILREIVPSFNASHQNISDGTDHINPASIRGLGPDQVLVLVNGKRRHASALVNINGTFGRGSVGTDLNAIPPAAIERIEVLRDGASAQYGSDAIAGVINIVLKDQTESLQASVRGGMTGGCFSQPDRPDGTPQNIDWDCDGEQVNVDANFGFPIGDGGFFNVTGAFLNRERTNRSGLEMKAQYRDANGDLITDVSATDAIIAGQGLTRADFSMTTGQSEAVVGMVFFNSSVPIGNGGELYAFGGVSRRDGAATGFFRRPEETLKTDLTLYPNGFLPEINTGINDDALSVGLRGNHSGWDVDLSLTHGANSLLYNIENTMNASLGSASPISFDSGKLSFGQDVGNLDLVRPINTNGSFQSLSLVTGAEFRVENYRIDAGDDASWQLGDGQGNYECRDLITVPAPSSSDDPPCEPRLPAAQVFQGFQPADEQDRTRNSISVYAGLESQITDQVTLDVGGRFENYTDFGSVFTGKIATRIELSPTAAFRGAVSTGFRAPSLHQSWFRNVSTQFVDDGSGNLVAANILTANNLSGIARAFGIPKLEEETSVNVSAGFTVNPSSAFSLTVDAYFITIDDRIVLTSRFSDSDSTTAVLLEPFSNFGVKQVQFFSNAIDTETKGLDIVASYGTEMSGGQLTLTGAANFTDTEVTSINVPASVQAVFGSTDVTSTYFNREETGRFESALPKQKGSVSAKWQKDRFTGTLRGNYYGEIEYTPTNSDNDETFGSKVLFDLDLAYELTESTRLSIGANNLLNTYPDQHTTASNRSDERFVFSRRVTQYGSNGGFYYAKMSLNLQ